MPTPSASLSRTSLSTFSISQDRRPSVLSGSAQKVSLRFSAAVNFYFYCYDRAATISVE